jgi:murein L,D-transpeptidase YafK
MKRLALILLLPCLAHCGEKQKTYVAPGNIKLTDHPRAAKAAARVRPDLERDLAEKNLRLGDPIFIRAFKDEMELEVFVRNRESGHYEIFRRYKIAASSGELGPKLAEGDGQVPEGFYFVKPAGMNPNSSYHLAFNIGYPNAFDQSLKRTGSAIMIHGNEVSIGCLAMTDAKIEEIYTLADAALQNGQPIFRVHLFPFRMSDERMEKSSGNPNIAFWKNLKQGYDLFEKNKTPPEANVSNGVYVFK